MGARQWHLWTLQITDRRIASGRTTIIMFPILLAADGAVDNCMPVHTCCHRQKTSEEDIPRIAKSNRVCAKHLGTNRRSSFQTNRDGPWKLKDQWRRARRQAVTAGGLACPGTVGQGKARKGSTRRGEAMPGAAMHGGARLGQARRGEAIGGRGDGTATQGALGKARRSWRHRDSYERN